MPGRRSGAEQKAGVSIMADKEMHQTQHIRIWRLPMATAVLQVRVNDKFKKRVDLRLKRMGLNLSIVVNMLMHQIDIQGRIPFEIVDRRNDLWETIEEIEAGIGLSKVYDTPEELYKELERENVRE